MQISREVFEQQRRPRFGTTNPERMQLAFWEWMIRGDEEPAPGNEGVLAQLGMMMRDGKLKSCYGPWRARDLFQIPVNREAGPIWTFDRMGQTRTPLPDGRLVCIGGEHEDWYDPDFYIYNDVVILGPEDQVEIYGYPREIFPPTDFHTATLIGNRLLIIGCLGYTEDRRPGHTPVYALDLSDYRITAIPTSGQMPGWLFRHEAEADAQRTIIVRGGEIIEDRGDEQRFRRNVEEYALDTQSWLWCRLTNRRWRQFSIRQEDHGLFVLEQDPPREALLPRNIPHTVEPGEDERRLRFLVQGVPVTVLITASAIEVIIEGQLPDDLASRIAEEVRANAAAAIDRPCVLEPD
jgi:hypothetical protein